MCFGWSKKKKKKKKKEKKTEKLVKKKNSCHRGWIDTWQTVDNKYYYFDNYNDSWGNFWTSHQTLPLVSESCSVK